MILFINACVREMSRTRRLAEHVLESLSDRDVKEVRLEDMDLPKVDQPFINKRNELYKQVDYSDPIFDPAKDFAAADGIVIAAPYWDLSFPAMLKQYFEQICVLGLTFFYNDQDQPQGLCKGRKLYYVTTAGGPIYSDAYGYGYVKALANTFFGIQDTECIKAENLDIVGADPEAILAETIREFDKK